MTVSRPAFAGSRELARPAASERFEVLKQRHRGPASAGSAGGGDGTTNRFLSRSRPAPPAEILGGISSSLPPPSFPRGRSATFFFALRRPAPGGRAGAQRGAAADEADRGRRLGDRRPRRRARASPASARVTLFEAARPFRRPRPHRRRHAARPHARRRHRLRRLQRAGLAEARRAPRRARRRDRRRGDVVLGADPDGRRRVEQRRASTASSPSARTCSGRRSGTCSARSSASTATPARWRATGARRRAATIRSAISSSPIASRRGFATGTCCR